MELQLRHLAEQNARKYRENRAYLQGYDSVGEAGRPLSETYRQKAGWVWAVERVRQDLKIHCPEKERFFSLLYHLDAPPSRRQPRENEIMKLSLILCVSPSTLYKWRESILWDLMLAAVQAGVIKPY